MRLSKRVLMWVLVLGSALMSESSALTAVWAWDDDPGSSATVLPENETIEFVLSDASGFQADDNVLGFLDEPVVSESVIPAVAMKRMQPQPDIDPSLEQAPTVALRSTELSTVFTVSQASILNQLSTTRRAFGRGPSSDFVLGLESSILSTSDIGDLLSRSNAILGVGSEHRTPIVTYNVARGKQVGQQAGAGSYWFPARQDLDTLMSKIDSRLVEDVLVIKGPYTARLGPALSFYDVQLRQAPRYANGYESHGETSLNWKQNGDQWYGRQTVRSGSSNWGFRLGYGDRAGSDYQTGLDSGPVEMSQMPSSYHSKDWDLALGWDPTPHQHIDFTYLRLDQSDVEFPGQIFDFDFLVTDAFELTYINECPRFCDRVELEGWFNRTRFAGNAQGTGKRRQIPLLENFFFTGRSLMFFTDVDASSAGYNFSATWGDVESSQLTLGTDLRYLKQELNEFGAAIPPFVSPLFGFPRNRSIPRSYLANPGVYVEADVPLTGRLKVRGGGRADWGFTNAFPIGDPDADGNPDDLEQQFGTSFDQSFDLGSGFVTAEYELGCHWTASAGAGFAMRMPTMTELYANGPFVSTLPQFVFTGVQGDPNLRPERMWQVDAGLDFEYQNVRGGLSGYYSWIDDYITYQRVFVQTFNVFNAVNDSLGTLKGFEMYGEVDLTCRVTAFATSWYVEGKNHVRDEPLPAIFPWNSRVGVRLHEPSQNPLWAVEFSARIVDDQDRVSQSLFEQTTPGFTLFDLRAYAQLTENVLFTLGVENIFDRFYQEHLDPHQFTQTVGSTTGIANFGVYQPGVNLYSGIVWEY